MNLKQVTFGDSTDYELSYGEELTKTPKGTQLSKVRELQVTRTIYSSGIEKRQPRKRNRSGGRNATYILSEHSISWI